MKGAANTVQSVTPPAQTQTTLGETLSYIENNISELEALSGMIQEKLGLAFPTGAPGKDASSSAILARATDALSHLQELVANLLRINGAL